MLIISTLATDTEYTLYKRMQDGKSLRLQAVKSILIKGGQGVMRRRELVTPQNGVITEVSDNDIELLLSNPVFIRHQKNGFIRIIDEAGSKKAASVVDSDMEKNDDSAQLTPEDFGSDAANLASTGDELRINGKSVAASEKKSRKRK